MTFLLGRATLCGMRGPLGQQLPRGIVQKSAVSQLMRMSASSFTPIKNTDSSSLLTPKSVMRTPMRSSSDGDHVKLWTAEKALSAALIPIIPAALLFPSAPLDYAMALTITLHSHWGIEAIVVDYVRPSIFGETIPKIAVALVYGLSVFTLGGLFYFIYADVGIANAIRLLWKL